MNINDINASEYKRYKSEKIKITIQFKCTYKYNTYNRLAPKMNIQY